MRSPLARLFHADADPELETRIVLAIHEEIPNMVERGLVIGASEFDHVRDPVHVGREKETAIKLHNLLAPLEAREAGDQSRDEIRSRDIGTRDDEQMVSR
jgi:hypothetical protein